MSQPHIIAERGEQWLVDIGNGEGRIYDSSLNILLPPRKIGSIYLRGYWEDTDKAPANIEQAIEQQLNVIIASKSASKNWYDR